MFRSAGTACTARGVRALVIGWQLHSWNMYSFQSRVEVHVSNALLRHLHLFEVRASISGILQVSQLAQLKNVVAHSAEGSTMRTEGHNH